MSLGEVVSIDMQEGLYWADCHMCEKSRRLDHAVAWYCGEWRIREADEERRLEDARADTKAVWHLADYYVPADVREVAKRWKMEETLIEIWRGAFIEGWRAGSSGRKIANVS